MPPFAESLSGLGRVAQINERHGLGPRHAGFRNPLAFEHAHEILPVLERLIIHGICVKGLKKFTEIVFFEMTILLSVDLPVLKG